MSTAPAGHHPDGSSIQKHSAGSHYPYVLVFRDTKASVQEPGGLEVWETTIAKPSCSERRRAAYARAIDAAEQLATHRRIMEASRVVS